MPPMRSVCTDSLINPAPSRPTRPGLTDLGIDSTGTSVGPPPCDGAGGVVCDSATTTALGCSVVCAVVVPPPPLPPVADGAAAGAAGAAAGGVPPPVGLGAEGLKALIMFRAIFF